MKKKLSTLILCLLAVTFGVTGCSRAQMNAEIAESIGTLGMYENNEPVETPKMKAEKEIQATKQEEEDNVNEHLEKAQRLAASYDYTNALAELAAINEEYQDDERVISAKVEYQRQQATLTTYGGDFAHFSVKSLIADKDRAFSDADMAYYYNNWSLTIDEFEQILQSLYDNNYILMSVYDLVVEVENEDGTDQFCSEHTDSAEMEKHRLFYPLRRQTITAIPITVHILIKWCWRMTAVSRMSTWMKQGNTLVGAYDVVPVVDAVRGRTPGLFLKRRQGNHLADGI